MSHNKNNLPKNSNQILQEDLDFSEDDDTITHEDHLITDLFFLDTEIKMPLMKLPVRSVVVSLKNDRRILFSPSSKLTQEQLQSLNSITDIVAPNLFHCAGIPKSISFFSSAMIWGPEGGKLVKPQIPFSYELTSSQWPYNDEIECHKIEGMPKVNEYIFYHKASKSIIVSDLCFNLTNTKGFGAWIILNLFGTYNKFATSRFFLKFVVDKKIFIESLQKILQLDFENIILSHGSNVFGDGKNKLRQALREKGFEIP